ncbi:MAG: hypothetical protein G3M70_06875 [Candidatus Nitronauta litoralis]|uniref:Uncharacterized protein n=1 Tax=Candidatus Nitronauta litoralis TaxID=2705533 RepID=A0A7T0G073_9BACT|nr:MAG: hypothetical protein G3M70_06875 [Candidatus Nitronauta litoralis]
MKKNTKKPKEKPKEIRSPKEESSLKEFEFLVHAENLIEHIEAIEEINLNVIPKYRQELKEREKEYDKLLSKYRDDLKKHKKMMEGIVNKNDKIDLKKIIPSLGRIGEGIKTQRGLVVRENAYTMMNQNLLIMMVSKFEIFITNILKAFFSCRPKSIQGMNRSESLENVEKLKTSKKNVESEIEKEIERILRDSHLSQIKYIEDKMNVKIIEHLNMLPEFVELTARRNLFVHNGGVVNSRYIDICRENKVLKKGTIKSGLQLEINTDYIEKASISSIEISFKIGHLIFRKMCEKDNEKIKVGNHFLRRLVNKFLEDKRWDLVIKVCDFVLTTQILSQCTEIEQKGFVFCKCIALRSMGKMSDCFKLLDSTNNTASNLNFIFIKLILLDKFEEAGTYMASNMKRSDSGYEEPEFFTLPLFNDFRETIHFKNVFREIYRKEFDEIGAQIMEASEIRYW